MAMSRKHYIKTAEIVASVRNDAERSWLIDQFIYMFADENPRFNAAKFAKYVHEKHEESLAGVA